MDASERSALVHGTAGAVARVTRAAGETHAAVLGVVRSALAPLGTAGQIPVEVTERVAAANYATVTGAARAAAAVTAPLAAATADPGTAPASTQPGAVAWLAALSAAFGDRMVLDPQLDALTVPMDLRRSGHVVDPASVDPAPGSGTLVVFVHGLGNHESMWSEDYLGAVEERGAVAVTVRYTTGQPIADSGAELADLLQRVVETWPVPVDRLVLVGHSMGGLVIREALDRDRAWRGLVRDVITLGTPHSGAPLERGARVALGIASANPVAAPIAALGEERSAGIKDLAFGDVAEPHAQVAWHLVAGSLGESGPLAWLGDGMVGVDSALAVPEDRTARRVRIAGVDHMALLADPDVARLIDEVLRGD
jgi:pimeloyl-ACP methyl ester carboxylesterase